MYGTVERSWPQIGNPILLLNLCNGRAKRPTQRLAPAAASRPRVS